MEFKSILFIARWLQIKIDRIPNKQELRTLVDYMDPELISEQDCDDAFSDLLGTWIRCAWCGKWILADDVWETDNCGFSYCCDECKIEAALEHKACQEHLESLRGY